MKVIFMVLHEGWTCFMVGLSGMRTEPKKWRTGLVRCTYCVHKSSWMYTKKCVCKWMYVMIPLISKISKNILQKCFVIPSLELLLQLICSVVVCVYVHRTPFLLIQIQEPKIVKSLHSIHCGYIPEEKFFFLFWYIRPKGSMVEKGQIMRNI